MQFTLIWSYSKCVTPLNSTEKDVCRKESHKLAINSQQHPGTRPLSTSPAGRAHSQLKPCMLGCFPDLPLPGRCRLLRRQVWFSTGLMSQGPAVSAVSPSCHICLSARKEAPQFNHFSQWGSGPAERKHAGPDGDILKCDHCHWISHNPWPSGSHSCDLQAWETHSRAKLLHFFLLV